MIQCFPVYSAPAKPPRQHIRKPPPPPSPATTTTASIRSKYRAVGIKMPPPPPTARATSGQKASPQAPISSPMVAAAAATAQPSTSSTGQQLGAAQITTAQACTGAAVTVPAPLETVRDAADSSPVPAQPEAADIMQHESGAGSPLPASEEPRAATGLHQQATPTGYKIRVRD